jgi:hypothetical protein
MKIQLTEQQVKMVTEKINDEVYFNTFSGAVQYARLKVENRGYVISDDDWFNEVSTGQGRPDEGQTTRMSIGLYKNDKLQRKALHIQVYNRGNQIQNNFELNYYVA